MGSISHAVKQEPGFRPNKGCVFVLWLRIGKVRETISISNSLGGGFRCNVRAWLSWLHLKLLNRAHNTFSSHAIIYNDYVKHHPNG